MKIVYDDKEGLCTSRTDPNDTSVITMMNLDDWFLPRDAIDMQARSMSSCRMDRSN